MKIRVEGSNPFRSDVSDKEYGVRLEYSNLSHRFPELNYANSYFEFDTIDEVIDFLVKKLGIRQRDIDFIRSLDSKTDHGIVSCTSSYTITKKYTDTSDYALF